MKAARRTWLEQTVVVGNAVEHESVAFDSNLQKIAELGQFLCFCLSILLMLLSGNGAVVWRPDEW